MKGLKKVLIILNLLLMLFFCIACGTSQMKDTPVEEKDLQEEENIDHTQYWSWNGNVYENTFAGIKFEKFENWHAYTNEELLQMQENDYANLMESVAEMYKDRIVYAASAQSEDKDSSFFICYENKTKLEEEKGKEMTLERYVSSYKTSMNFMGYKELTLISESTEEFCGSTYTCLQYSIYTSYNGGGYITKNVYMRQIDDYFITITLTTSPFGEESMEEMISRCSEL